MEQFKKLKVIITRVTYLPNAGHVRPDTKQLDTTAIIIGSVNLYLIVVYLFHE